MRLSLFLLVVMVSVAAAYVDKEDGAHTDAAHAAWARPSKNQSRHSCRCFPGDTCWPSPITWRAFNATIGGKLIATTPLGAACHDSAFAPYSSTRCAALRAEWFKPQPHMQSPSSIMAPLFTNNSCNPFLDRGAACIVGAYTSYSVNVTSTMDISQTIWFATYFNIRLVIKNTGHDYNGKSTGAGSISIWTRNLQSVDIIDYKSVAYTGKAIKVGAGVTMLDVYTQAKAYGRAIVGGETPTVGYAGGYTQGGGHSLLASKYGLAAHQVLEWEVVDGLGRVRRATPTIHPDLYWALCGGGGGTYGIVTLMISKTYPDVPVTGATLSFAGNDAAKDDFYDALSAFLASVPAIVDAGAAAVWFFTNASFVISPLTAPGLQPDQVHKLLQPLRDRLVELRIPYRNYLDHFVAQGAQVPVGVGLYGGRLIPRSVVVNNNSDLTAAYRYINRQGGTIAGVGLKVPAAVMDNLRTSVNPAWRDSLISNVIQMPYDHTAPLEKMQAVQNTITHNLLPSLERLTPSGGAYLNEGDFQQPLWQAVFYGSNYATLNRIKSRYDPFHNFYALTAVGSEYWKPQNDGRLCRN